MFTADPETYRKYQRDQSMRTAFLLLALSLPSIVCAQSAEQKSDQPNTGWTLGVLGISRDTAYRQLDDDTLAVPFAQYDGERFYWRGLRAGWRAFEDDKFEFDLIAQIRTDGYDPDESPFFVGMDERERSLDVGASATVRPGFGDISASIVTDALGRSDGQEVTVSWGYSWRVGPIFIRPEIAARWQSQSMVDYYYGVRPSEATALRPAYEADSAVFADASLNLIIPFSKRWISLLRVGYTRLPDEAANSPIVEDDNELTILAGIGYRF